MEAKDLRIGNCVNRKFWNPDPNRGGHWSYSIATVDRIGADHVNVKLKSGEILKYPIEDLEPVLLSDEWLRKFGFVIRFYAHGFKDAFIGENPVTKDWLLRLKNTGEEWFYRNGHFEIKHVHQLQNLYYALTGEELTIREATHPTALR